MNQKQQFLETVLKMYLDIPDTPHSFNSHDSYIAKLWFDQGISILQIQQAMTLAQIRRAFRRPGDLPLNPIRSLHYFAPIIQEIQSQPIDEQYFRYLQRKLNDASTKLNLNGTRSDSSSSS